MLMSVAGDRGTRVTWLAQASSAIRFNRSSRRATAGSRSLPCAAAAALAVGRAQRSRRRRDALPVEDQRQQQAFRDRLIGRQQVEHLHVRGQDPASPGSCSCRFQIRAPVAQGNHVARRLDEAARRLDRASYAARGSASPPAG